MEVQANHSEADKRRISITSYVLIDKTGGFPASIEVEAAFCSFLSQKQGLQVSYFTINSPSLIFHHSFRLFHLEGMCSTQQNLFFYAKPELNNRLCIPQQHYQKHFHCHFSSPPWIRIQSIIQNHSGWIKNKTTQIQQIQCWSPSAVTMARLHNVQQSRRSAKGLGFGILMCVSKHFFRWEYCFQSFQFSFWCADMVLK